MEQEGQEEEQQQHDDDDCMILMTILWLITAKLNKRHILK
jgi:hypothetical protein